MSSDFLRRAETFGFDTGDPWALPALRLVYHAPRVYKPLLDAWERRYPGATAAMRRLVDLGFVAHQEPVFVDSVSRTEVERPKTIRTLRRFRTTAAGTRHRKGPAAELSELFPRTPERNLCHVQSILKHFDVSADRAPAGISARSLVDNSPFDKKSTYRWVDKLCAAGLIRELPQQHPDVVETVPEHWRATKELTAQLRAVVTAFSDDWGGLHKEFRLGRRSRQLNDISVVRSSVAGTTDYSHDIAAQHVLAELLRSNDIVADSVSIEPHHTLTVETSTRPWSFREASTGIVAYQPDLTVVSMNPSRRTLYVEYERLQSRRRAWTHIERLLGYLQLRTFSFEEATLLFVVETSRRERTYVELIEAFADYTSENNNVLPANSVTLGVASLPRVRELVNPADPTGWFTVALPGGSADGRCVLHDVNHSPFNQYFGAED